MDSGLIAQIGSAEDCISADSRFVAGFLGSANLLRGTVVAVESEEPSSTSSPSLGAGWTLPVAAGQAG